MRQIGRVVFEGSANPNYRALVQSLLLDYLGLANTGRETRTLVGILPEFFLVAGENAQGEGAIVTLKEDVPDVGDDEVGDMARVRRAVDEYEREDIERRRPAANEDSLLRDTDDEDDRRPRAPGNEDVVPEVVAAAAGEPAASDPAADARQRRAFDAAVRAIFGRGRADGGPSRRGPRPR